MAAAGFDAGEVPPQRSAQQRRRTALAKTDTVDAVATARALLAEPSLGPVQALEAYDGLVAKIEAVLEHRRMLVETRTLTLHYVQDQLAKLPTDVRDRLTSRGKIETRLQRLAALELDPAEVSTSAGSYRLSWLVPFAEQDRRVVAEIRRLERDLARLLDAHGTTLRDEPGIGVIAAATLVVEVGDAFRFASESSSPAGVGPVRSPCRPVRAELRRSDTGWTSAATGASTASSTSPASPNNASRPRPASTSNASWPRARPAAPPDAPTSDTSPTASSDACGKTKHSDENYVPHQAA